MYRRDSDQPIMSDQVVRTCGQNKLFDYIVQIAFIAPALKSAGQRRRCGQILARSVLNTGVRLRLSTSLVCSVSLAVRAKDYSAECQWCVVYADPA